MLHQSEANSFINQPQEASSNESMQSQQISSSQEAQVQPSPSETHQRTISLRQRRDHSRVRVSKYELASIFNDLVACINQKVYNIESIESENQKSNNLRNNNPVPLMKSKRSIKIKKEDNEKSSNCENHNDHRKGLKEKRKESRDQKQEKNLIQRMELERKRKQFFDSYDQIMKYTIHDEQEPEVEEEKPKVLVIPKEVPKRCKNFVVSHEVSFNVNPISYLDEMKQ